MRRSRESRFNICCDEKDTRERDLLFFFLLKQPCHILAAKIQLTRAPVDLITENTYYMRYV